MDTENEVRGEKPVPFWRAGKTVEESNAEADRASGEKSENGEAIPFWRANKSAEEVTPNQKLYTQKVVIKGETLPDTPEYGTLDFSALTPEVYAEANAKASPEEMMYETYSESFCRYIYTPAIVGMLTLVVALIGGAVGNKLAHFIMVPFKTDVYFWLTRVIPGTVFDLCSAAVQACVALAVMMYLGKNKKFVMGNLPLFFCITWGKMLIPRQLSAYCTEKINRFVRKEDRDALYDTIKSDELGNKYETDVGHIGVLENFQICMQRDENAPEYAYSSFAYFYLHISEIMSKYLLWFAGLFLLGLGGTLFVEIVSYIDILLKK
jgi:hypothetical protein